MAKKSKMEILMAIKAKVDKALPANIGQISEEMKKLKENTKGLKDAEKLYSKQKLLKKALQENKTQYKKQIEELRKLKKVKDGNKKLTKSEEKLYRRLKGEMKKLSKTMDKQKIKSNEYKIQVSKLGMTFDEVKKKMKETGKEMDVLNAKKKISDKVLGVKKKIGSGVKKGVGYAKKAVVGGAIAGTIALGAFSMDSAKNYTEFSGQMKRVQALSRSTKEEFNLMENAAIKLGSTTSFTSQQAGEGMEFLALAGFNANQIIETMPGLLDLAAASGEDLGMVADIVSDNLSAFGLAAKDAGHFADVMALASSSTNTTVGMLGEAFTYVAAPAHALGVSLEETSAILGLMANNGIKASQAGTTLRSALLNLAAPTKEAQGAIKELGLQTKGKDGNFIGMGNVIEQLQEKFKDLTDVQQASYAKALFGKNAVSGLLSVINSAPGSISKMTKELENSGGTAKKMANDILDGPNGAITLLTSSYDGLRISFGKKLMGDGTVKGIKTITHYISELSNVINGSFSDNPANKFWQNIFATTKEYIGKFKEAIKPLKESLANIFSGGDIKKNLKYLGKLVVESVLTIIKAIGKILDYLEPVIKFLIDHKDTILVFFGAFSVIGTVVGWVSSLIAIFSGFAGIIPLIVGGFSTLWTVMMALGGPIVWIGAAITMIGYALYKNYDSTKSWVENIKNLFSYLFNLLPNFIQNFISWYMNIWKTLFDFTIYVIVGIVSFFKFLVVSMLKLVNCVGLGFISLIKVISELPSLLIENITRVFNLLMELIPYWISEIVNWVTSGFNSMIDAVVEFGTTILNKIQEIFNMLPEPIQNFISWYMNIWETLVGWYIGIWTNMFSSLKQIFTDFKNGNITFMEGIKKSIMVVPNAIKDAYMSVFDTIKGKMAEVKEMIKLPQPPEWVMGIVTKVKSAVGIDGSHYNGLSNVPYDGYIAELHKDERVLTADENQEYNSVLGAKFNNIKSMGSTNSTTTNKSDSKFIFNPIINLTINGGGDMDDKANKAIERLQREMEELARSFKDQMEAMYGNTRTSF